MITTDDVPLLKTTWNVLCDTSWTTGWRHRVDQTDVQVEASEGHGQRCRRQLSDQVNTEQRHHTAANQYAWFPWFLRERRYLIDLELTEVTDKIHDFIASEVRHKFYVGNWPKMGTTPSPNQSDNQKLTRSQNYVHKISLATANASWNASYRL